MTRLSACLELAGTEVTEYLLCISWIVLCQLGTRDGHLRGGNLTVIELQGRLQGVFLVSDVGGPSPSWVLPPQGWLAWVL